MHQQPSDDVTNVERQFVGGGDDALRAAYDAHGALIYSFCRKTLGADAATDATQEVFLAAWRNRAGFDPAKGALAGWLVGIARNKVIDALRSAGRRPSTQPIADHEAMIAVDEIAIDGLANRMLIRDALSSLGPRAQMVVELAFLEDLTHRQIAERCDLPLGTVKSDIKRGLERLRFHMELADG